MISIDEKNAKEIIRLLKEIDKEARNGFRVLRVLNLTRRIRLIINKSRHGRYRKSSPSEHSGCPV